MKPRLNNMQRRAVNFAINRFRHHVRISHGARVRLEWDVRDSGYITFTLRKDFTGKTKHTMLAVLDDASATFALGPRGKLTLFSYFHGVDSKHAKVMRGYLARATKATVPSWAR